MKKRIIAAIVCVAGVLGSLAATAIAQRQRFPDVPPDHYAHEAIEWAAEVGVTLGYTDGTFKPERPLPKRHAVVFMERYYDEILQATESEDFTRGDMMVLLKAINDGGTSSTPVTTLPVADQQLDLSHWRTFGTQVNPKDDSLYITYYTSDTSHGGIGVFRIQCFAHGLTWASLVLSRLVLDDDYQDEGITVEYRIGNRPLESDNWWLRDDNKEIAPWDASTFVGKLDSMSRIRFWVDNIHVLEFNITGMAAIKSHCLDLEVARGTTLTEP